MKQNSSKNYALFFSESEESFKSVSTNPNQTNYRINSEPNTPQRTSPRKLTAGQTKSTIGNQLIRDRNQRSKPQQPTTSGTMRPTSKPAAAGASKLNISKTKQNSRKQREESSEEESSGPPAPAPVARRPRKPQKVTKKKTQDYIIMQDVIRLQQSVNYLIPKATFSRLVRELVQKSTPRGADFKVSQKCLEVLQEASEVYTTATLSDSYLITLSRKQVTLQPKDVQLLNFLRGPH